MKMCISLCNKSLLKFDYNGMNHLISLINLPLMDLIGFLFICVINNALVNIFM